MRIIFGITILMLCVFVIHESTCGADVDSSLGRPDSSAKGCCGGPGSSSWHYFRFVKGELVDDGGIAIAKPGISRIVVPVGPHGEGHELDLIVIRYGPKVQPWRAPHFNKPGTYFFGRYENIGSISAMKVEEDEYWEFDFSGHIVKATNEVPTSSITITYEYDLGEEELTWGEIPVAPNEENFIGSLSLKGSPNKSGNNHSFGVYLAGSSAGGIGYPEVAKKYYGMRVPIPEELGWLYVSPRIPGAICKVFVAGLEFQKECD